MHIRFYPNGPIKAWHGHGPRTAFMIPQVEWFSNWEAACLKHDLEEELMEELDPSDYTEGWYFRLSAPGYLDCTSWTGPFKNAFRAIRWGLRFYDIDLDGQDVE